LSPVTIATAFAARAKATNMSSSESGRTATGGTGSTSEPCPMMNASNRARSFASIHLANLWSFKRSDSSLIVWRL
jgi:hypothetical protein